RQVGADIRHGKGDTHMGAPPGPADGLALEIGACKAGHLGRLQLLDGKDLGGGALAQFVGLVGDAHEGAARLLAGHDVGDPARIERRLYQVGRLYAFGAHAQIADRSGKGLTASLPSQPSDAARMRSNMRPFGPMTSESSITVPGWASRSK